ncbi:MAG: hypothetical protein GY861_11685 [bacterium]|nr:hypothetical protein [bacterium]
MVAALQNWQRHYRITFGVPAYEKESYYTEGSVIPNSISARISATQAIPSDALMISNIPEDGNALRGFNFTFESKRTYSKTATSSEISTLNILNLNPEMYNLFNTEGCVVRIEAGYRDTGVSVVYNGFVQRVDVNKSGADVSYKILMKDAGFDVKNTKVSVDFPEKSDIVEVLGSLVKMFPSVSSQSLALEALKGTVVAGGFSYTGKLIDVIEKICKTYKVDYTLFNSKFSARMKEIIQGDADYNKLAPNTFVFPPENIKSLDPVIDNSQKASAEPNVKRDVLLSSFLTPIDFDNFFTVPETVNEKLAGTYKIKTIQTKLNSRTNVWDTVLVGSPM